MTVTIIKCDFCEQEISPKITKCRTTITIKSNDDRIKPLHDQSYDICHDCLQKMLNCLYDKCTPQ
jgi:hypothetical protein